MQALFKWSAEEVSQIQQIEFDHFCSSSCHGVEILQCISFHYNSHFCKALVIIKTLQKKKERGEWGNIQFSIVLVVSNGRPWHPRLSGGGRVRVRLRHMGANADSIRKPGKYKKKLKKLFSFFKIYKYAFRTMSTLWKWRVEETICEQVFVCRIESMLSLCRKKIFRRLLRPRPSPEPLPHPRRQLPRYGRRRDSHAQVFKTVYLFSHQKGPHQTDG